MAAPLTPFTAEVDHRDDAACCDSYLPAGTVIVVTPDGSAWHPECAESAGYLTATN